MTAVRALLMADDDLGASAISRLGDADMQAYDALLQAVLAVAAGQRFADGYTEGDVIRYVARVRAGTDVRTEDMDLDPKTGEAMLGHALGKPAPHDPGPQIRLRASLALLTVILGDLKLSEPALDALLTDARTIADRWLAVRG
ncbi:MAG: hypothetical protein J2P25_08025 [Nocardiopsaceae bacterium]|nr:hypothetical protein [Nocardiopsaceae bacterium]